MEESWLKRNIPILSWLPAYDRSWFTADAIAGLTVWGLVVPEIDGIRRGGRLAAPVWTIHPCRFAVDICPAGDIAPSFCPANIGNRRTDRFIGDSDSGRYRNCHRPGDH